MQLRNLLHPELDAEIRRLVKAKLDAEVAANQETRPLDFLRERFGANSVEVAHEYLREAHQLLLSQAEHSEDKILELTQQSLNVFSSAYV
jgi:hypothetical protein